jgi:hypothetical protein
MPGPTRRAAALLQNRFTESQSGPGNEGRREDYKVADADNWQKYFLGFASIKRSRRAIAQNATLCEAGLL